MDFGSEIIFTDLKFNDAGLIPVVVQQFDTKAVLMMAWMNQEALSRTIESKQATYWSRSRNLLWTKGKTSGNLQRVISIAVDCDSDTLLLTVDQTGVACHTGATTCFDEKEIQVES
jgi:phosphoribosyl-AMP cyclohydrolase